MKLRVKAVIALFLFGFFVLFACSGCSSSDSDTDSEVKLISAEGEADGYSSETSYTYDGQDRLTSLYSKVVTDDLSVEKKDYMPSSAEVGSEYRLQYDDNGNITQVQLWSDIFEDEELVSTTLSAQCDYTYVDNRLTESVESMFNYYEMADYRMKRYEYDDSGDLVTIQVYWSEDYDKAFAATAYQVLTMTYDENQNLTQVEEKYTNDSDPSGNTYVLTYNTDNQLEKHERFAGVDLEIDETTEAASTYELVYDNIANTVTVTDTDDALYSNVYGFLGEDVGYLYPVTWTSYRGVTKSRRSTPLASSVATLIPSNLAQLLFVSASYDYYDDPVELLSAQQLIIERTYLYTGDPSEETTYFDTIMDENNYPQTMTFYNSSTDVAFDENFIWE